MTTNYHTPIAVGAAANAATFNAPLGQLDAVLGTLNDTVTNAVTGVYNVREYGATGDGSTDDTAAIQAAINAASGKIIYLPPGTYIFSADLYFYYDNTHFVGAGIGITTIKAKSTHTGRGLLIINASGIRVADLTIDMNSSATANQSGRQAQQAIYIVSTSAGGMTDLIVERVECKNSHDRLIDIVDTQIEAMDVTVRDCYLHDCVDIALCATSTKYLHISNNRIENVTTYECLVVTGSVGNESTNTTIIGNDINNGGQNGIALAYAWRSVISGNRVHDCSNATNSWGIAISLGCVDFSVVGNTVTACDGGIAIDIAVSVPETQAYDARGVITGNTISGSTVSHGIYAACARGLIIAGNNCMDNNYDGVALVNCKDCIVTGNTLFDNGDYGFGVYSSGDISSDGGHEVSGNYMLGNTLGPWNDSEADIRSNIITRDVLWGNAESSVMGIGTIVPAAKLHIDQSNTTLAKPVLTLDQADVSEEFIRFIGTSTTDASQSLVDAADMEDPGTIVGWLKIYVQDDQGTNPITDGAYYIPFYSAPTHSP